MLGALTVTLCPLLYTTKTQDLPGMMSLIYYLDQGAALDA